MELLLLSRGLWSTVVYGRTILSRQLPKVFQRPKGNKAVHGNQGLIYACTFPGLWYSQPDLFSLRPRSLPLFAGIFFARRLFIRCTSQTLRAILFCFADVDNLLGRSYLLDWTIARMKDAPYHNNNPSRDVVRNTRVYATADMKCISFSGSARPRPIMR